MSGNWIDMGDVGRLSTSSASGIVPKATGVKSAKVSFNGERDDGVEEDEEVACRRRAGWFGESLDEGFVVDVGSTKLHALAQTHSQTKKPRYVSILIIGSQE